MSKTKAELDDLKLDLTCVSCEFFHDADYLQGGCWRTGRNPGLRCEEYQRADLAEWNSAPTWERWRRVAAMVAMLREEPALLEHHVVRQALDLVDGWEL